MYVVQALCYVATVSNTGWLNSACVLLEKKTVGNLI